MTDPTVLKLLGADPAALRRELKPMTDAAGETSHPGCDTHRQEKP